MTAGIEFPADLVVGGPESFEHAHLDNLVKPMKLVAAAFGQAVFPLAPRSETRP